MSGRDFRFFIAKKTIIRKTKAKGKNGALLKYPNPREIPRNIKFKKERCPFRILSIVPVAQYKNATAIKSGVSLITVINFSDDQRNRE
jgi:hypothetical protein